MYNIQIQYPTDFIMFNPLCIQFVEMYRDHVKEAKISKNDREKALHRGRFTELMEQKQELHRILNKVIYSYSCFPLTMQQQLLVLTIYKMCRKCLDDNVVATTYQYRLLHNSHMYMQTIEHALVVSSFYYIYKVQLCVKLQQSVRNQCLSSSDHELFHHLQKSQHPNLVDE